MRNLVAVIMIMTCAISSAETYFNLSCTSGNELDGQSFEIIRAGILEDIPDYLQIAPDESPARIAYVNRSLGVEPIVMEPHFDAYLRTSRFSFFNTIERGRGPISTVRTIRIELDHPRRNNLGVFVHQNLLNSTFEPLTIVTMTTLFESGEEKVTQGGECQFLPPSAGQL